MLLTTFGKVSRERIADDCSDGGVLELVGQPELLVFVGGHGEQRGVGNEGLLRSPLLARQCSWLFFFTWLINFLWHTLCFIELLHLSKWQHRKNSSEQNW